MNSETKIWEYKASSPGWPLIHPQDIAQWLNGFGRDGWELVLRDDHGNWVFKRPSLEIETAGAATVPAHLTVEDDGGGKVLDAMVARRRGVRIK